MADSCQTCFFAKPNINVSSILECHLDHPDKDTWWPVVEPSHWCGEGYNTQTGRYHLPTATGYGDLMTSNDQSLTNANLVDVPELQTGLVAPNRYFFQVIIYYTDAGGGGAGGIQLAMVASGGLVAALAIYDGWQIDTTGISGQARSLSLGGVVANADSRGVNAEALIYGAITVSTSGTIKVQAGQNSLNANQATIIKAGSHMAVRAVP